MATDNKAIAKELYDLITEQAKRSSRGASGSGSPKKDPNQKKLDDATKGLGKTAKELAKQLDAIHKKFKNVDHTLEESNKQYKDNLKRQSAIFARLMQNDKITDKQQDKLLEKLKKLTVNSSKFGKQLIKDVKTVKDFEKVMKQTGGYLEKFSDIVKETGEKQLRNIKDIDELGLALIELADQLGDVQSISEINAAVANDNREALEKLADKFQSTADDMTKLREASADAAKKTALMAEVAEKAKKGLEGLTESIFGANLAAAMFGKLGFGAALLFTGIALLTAGVSELYNKFDYLGSAGLGGLYSGDGLFSVLGNMVDAAILTKELGIDMEKLAEIIKNNKNEFADMGFGPFTSYLKTTGDELRRFGVPLEEAREASGAFAGMLQEAGVDLSNASELAKATKDQLSAYETIKAVTGETAAEFARTNKSIVENNKNTQLILRYGKARGKQLVSEIAAERARLALMGLTTEQQKAIIEQNSEILGAKVTDRFDMAANALQAASITGNEAMGQRLYDIILKGNAATAEEKKFLTDGLMKLGTDVETMAASGDLGAQHLSDTLKTNLEKLGIGKFQEAARTKMTESVTPVEAQNAKNLQKVPEIVLETQNVVRAIKSLWSDPIVKLILGLLATIAGAVVLMSAFNTAGKLVDLFKGGGGGIFGKMKDWFTKKPGIEGPMPQGMFGKLSDFLAKDWAKTKEGWANSAGKAASGAAKFGGSIAEKATSLGTKAGPAIAAAGGKVAGSLATAGGAVASVGSKVIGGVMSAGPALLKAAKFLGPAALAATAAYDTFQGVSSAGDYFGTDEATTGQKFASGAAGLASGLTFGLIDPKILSNSLYSAFVDAEEATAQPTKPAPTQPQQVMPSATKPEETTKTSDSKDVKKTAKPGDPKNAKDTSPIAIMQQQMAEMRKMNDLLAKALETQKNHLDLYKTFEKAKANKNDPTNPNQKAHGMAS